MPPKKVNKDGRPKVPAAVTAAARIPPPTQTSVTTRNGLLPYLALGFGPIDTSGVRLLCGVNALHRSYREARIALAAPSDAPLKHPTQKDFKALLGGKLYMEIFEEYLQQWRTDGGGWSLPLEVLEEQREEARRPRDINITSMSHLLDTANRTWGTNFELGVITQGYRCIYRRETQTWDSDFAFPTNANAQQQSNGRPIIWVWNNNGDTIQRALGGEGGFNHWEAFGSPNAVGTPDRREFIQNWNLGGIMREHTAAGVWRVIRDQLAASGEVTVAVGAFVHAAPPPERVDVPVGSRYVATASEETFLAISEDDLIQIELHADAPDPLEGGPANIDEGESEGPGEKEGKNNIHDDVKTEFNATLKAVLDKVNVLTFFRAVSPTNRVGGELTDEELPSFTKRNLAVTNGDFFLDLGERNGPWARVRNIEGREGWAHARRLQALELPWNLPSSVPFKVKWIAYDAAWDMNQIINEQQKRGLAEGLTQNSLDAVRDWDNERTAVLPMCVMEYPAEGQVHGTWSDNTKILHKEVVLEAAVIEENVSTKIVSFDRETAVIGPDDLSYIPQAAWGIRILPEELTSLLQTIRNAPSATDPTAAAAAPAAIEVTKEKKSPSKEGKKRSREEDDKDSEDHESPKAPKKTKGKGRPKKTTKKVTFKDDDSDDSDELSR